jgi:hypothetical protein
MNKLLIAFLCAVVLCVSTTLYADFRVIKIETTTQIAPNSELKTYETIRVYIIIVAPKKLKQEIRS